VKQISQMKDVLEGRKRAAIDLVADLFAAALGECGGSKDPKVRSMMMKLARQVEDVRGTVKALGERRKSLGESYDMSPAMVRQQERKPFGLPLSADIRWKRLVQIGNSDGFWLFGYVMPASESEGPHAAHLCAFTYGQSGAYNSRSIIQTRSFRKLQDAERWIDGFKTGGLVPMKEDREVPTE